MPTVLVADESPNIHKLLSKTLAASGTKVESALMGHTVLQRIAAGGVDVLITETHLPDLPAWRLIPQVRALDQNLPVVILTGDDSEETSRRVRISAGPVFFYALKPPIPDQIRQVVHCALKWRKKYAAQSHPILH